MLDCVMTKSQSNQLSIALNRLEEAAREVSEVYDTELPKHEEEVLTLVVGWVGAAKMQLRALGVV